MDSQVQEELEQPQESQVPEVPAGPTVEELQAQLDAQKTKAEDEVRKRQQVEQMMQNIILQNQQMAHSAPQQGRDMFGELGVSADDLYTQEGMQRFAGGVQKYIGQQVQQGISRFGVQQFLGEHPDFGSVVGQSYGNQFVPAPAFQAACAKEPYLNAAVNGLMASGDTLGAMRLAYSKAQEAVKPPASPNQGQVPGAAQQTLAAVAPTSPTSVGGGGAFGAVTQVGQMSDDEFNRLSQLAASTPA